MKKVKLVEKEASLAELTKANQAAKLELGVLEQELGKEGERLA